MNTSKIIKAGKIASEVKAWIKPQIKKGMPLLEIAEKIEDKIIELGGQPAFPTNLSIDEKTAHYTPSYNDESIAEGLLKVDFGAHVDGWCSDTAFTIDLEGSEENKKLIQTAEKALAKAIETINENVETGEIGKAVQETIQSEGFAPIVNLSGHQIDKYDLHAGLTIPNVDNQSNFTIEKGLYAIEPFVTLSNAAGHVKDSGPSGIYALVDSKNVRSPIARELLDYILEEHETLPFCSRWLVKKFGTKALLGLRQLEQNENLHHYNSLIEASGAKVAQAENTVLIEKEKIVTTE